MSVTWKSRSVLRLSAGAILAGGALYVAYHAYLQFLLSLFQFQT